MPLRPVGNSEACQANSRSAVKRLVILARGVEHHFDDTFDVAVGGLERADIHPEPPGDRRSDLFGIELSPFDFAALEHVRRQRLRTAS